jgi:ubiquitin conjugation factor E4 B
MEKLAGPATPKSDQTSGGENRTPSASSGLSTPAAPQTVEPTSKPKITIHQVNHAPATSETSLTKVGSQPSDVTSTPPVRSTSEAGSLKRPRAEPDVQTTTRAPAPKAPKQSVDEDIDTYENRILGQIFRITLDPDQRVDASHHKLIYLPNLRQELEDENAPIRLSKDRLDSAILEACSSIPHNKPVLDYLLPCWKRIMKALKGLRGHADGKDAVLKEAKRLCMSNCIFAVEVPELFGSVVCWSLRADG